MKMSATVKSSFHQLSTTVSTNDAGKELRIDPKANGYGSSINGGEMLLLSLATCFCNDLYREAAKRNIVIEAAEVIFNGEFGAEGEPGFNFTYKANISSGASAAEIEDLIRYTDTVAEIHNTLRKGLAITLAQ